MPIPYSKQLFTEDDITRQNHLAFIFANCQTEQITRGELERLRCMEREVRALASALLVYADEPVPDLSRVLVQGSVLSDLFKLTLGISA